MKLSSLVRAACGALVWVSLVSPVVLRSAEADLAPLRAKAESGNAIAQYNLGLAFAEGRTVPKDLVEAYVWLTLAAENGATGKALKALAPTLSADQVTTAQVRLVERRSLISTRLLAQANQAPGASISVSVAPPAPPTIAPANTAADNCAPSLEQEIATLRADKAKLSAEVAMVWKELDGAKATTAAAVARADEAGGMANRRAKEISALQAERDQLRQQLATALAAAKPPARGPDDQAKALAADQARAQGADQASALGAARAELKKITAQLDSVRQELTAARATNADLAAQIKKLAGEDETRKGQLAAGRDAVRRAEEAQATIARLQGEIADLKAKAAVPAPAPAAAEAPVEELTRLKQELARAKGTVDMTVRSYALTRAENERLKAQLEKIQQALAPAASPH